MKYTDYHEVAIANTYQNLFMRKSVLPGLLILFLFHTRLNAQPPCAFDINHRSLSQAYPIFAQLVEENNAVIRKHIEARKSRRNDAARLTSTVYIPVVVHVMHTGGAVGTVYNPSDAQITGAINYLNQVYAGTYPGMSAPVEGGGVVDMEVQFALAQRTPNCGATNGINRVDASSLPNYVANGVNAENNTGCPDLTLKNFSRWSTSDYYNIWVVNKIDGADGTSGQFIAGYAYFPGAPSALDGTVMLATQMQTGRKTLPHEIGHALGLYHTFEGSANSTQCPPNANCTTQGDRVCDTDPVSMNLNSMSGIFSFACRTGANACAGANNYTINTESNFMAYTNCYTLFTNGQKDRVQAALLLPSRASLTSTANLALTPCGTTINFSQSTVARTEMDNGTPDGCRRYTDYTYQLAIGAAPTATAIATLTFGGTAIKGLDYEITTNGNFINPLNTLTFSAGSVAPQSFTVRIYDDAEVETGETIIVDFTIDSGGGDAVKGTNTPSFTFHLADNDKAPTGSSSGTYAIGVAGSAINATPFDARLQQHRAQYLYKADELLNAGVKAGEITSFQLSIQSKLSTRPFTNFTIRMAQTDLTYLYDSGVTAIGGMTTVYSSPSYATIAGWNNFILNTPFTWNGTSSLAIEICFDNGSADAGNSPDVVRTFLDGGSALQGNTFYQNTISCSQAFSSVSVFNLGRKPIIQLGNNVTGTEIETTVASTSNLYMGTSSTDYFYSNNNRLMMQLRNLDAPLECVTTELLEAGNTWHSYNGGERSGKVFSVTPASNGNTTEYTISLYFTESELAGKNPGTLLLAKTTAASVALSNPGNTIYVLPAVASFGSGATVFTGTFTGFSRFFLVDGGVILPVVLTNFSGEINPEGHNLLSWQTSYEYNNRGFDVETSTNGIDFHRLATIPSKGNSGVEQPYRYLHHTPPTGVNYYRLRQTDLDGRFEYSKVISLMVQGKAIKPVIYPVPAKNTLVIDFGKITGAGELEIFTADMKLIRREKLSTLQNRKVVQVDHLAKGLYFIRFTTGTQTGILQFVKD